MMTSFFHEMQEIAHNDVIVLQEKGKSYGDSWKRRGGIGAFMMLARKWDRLELTVEKHGYDVFTAILQDQRDEGVLDDIADLRRYLLLVETEMRRRMAQPKPATNRETAEEILRKFKEGIPAEPFATCLKRPHGATLGGAVNTPTEHPYPFGYDGDK